LGGKPAYERRRVKGRSPRQTRHSVASALSRTNDVEIRVFASDARRRCSSPNSTTSAKARPARRRWTWCWCWGD